MVIYLLTTYRCKGQIVIYISKDLIYRIPCSIIFAQHLFLCIFKSDLWWCKSDLFAFISLLYNKLTAHVSAQKYAYVNFRELLNFESILMCCFFFLFFSKGLSFFFKFFAFLDFLHSAEEALRSCVPASCWGSLSITTDYSFNLETLLSHGTLWPSLFCCFHPVIARSVGNGLSVDAA